MTQQPIVFTGSPGQSAYAAWCDEFGHNEDPWCDLSQTSQDAWEEIAERTATDTVMLPRNGYEVSVRTHSGSVHFAWTGNADAEMTDAMLCAIKRAAQGDGK
jgi:hypothetical protein